jgi:hypothetical protein
MVAQYVEALLDRGVLRHFLGKGEELVRDDWERASKAMPSVNVPAPNNTRAPLCASLCLSVPLCASLCLLQTIFVHHPRFLSVPLCASLCLSVPLGSVSVSLCASRVCLSLSLFHCLSLSVPAPHNIRVNRPELSLGSENFTI